MSGERAGSEFGAPGRRLAATVGMQAIFCFAKPP